MPSISEILFEVRQQRQDKQPTQQEEISRCLAALTNIQNPDYVEDFPWHIFPPEISGVENRYGRVWLRDSSGGRVWTIDEAIEHFSS